MMQYEQALRLQARLESPGMDDATAAALVRTKFDYVVAAQMYGEIAFDL
jgi:hypothetical protein